MPTNDAERWFAAFSSDTPLPAHMQQPEGPLGAALQDAIEHHWRGMPSASRNASQARIAVRTIQYVAGIEVAPEGVTKAHLKAAVSRWLAAGTTPSTAVARLNCLSKLGVDVKGTRPKVPRKTKWWLDDANEAKIVSALLATGLQREEQVARFIRWTTRTGLRIEESLRLTWADIRVGKYTTVSVPGTKTATAQANLVMSNDAQEVLSSIPRGEDHERVFNLAYWEVQRIWLQYRKVFGLPDPYVATLKALRRSAARALHGIKGMPLDLVRQYLRHESVSTTMNYLRLTGGYSEEEVAKWL